MLHPIKRSIIGSAHMHAHARAHSIFILLYQTLYEIEVTDEFSLVIQLRGYILCIYE